MSTDIQREAIQTRSTILSDLVSGWIWPSLVSLMLVALTTVVLWYMDKWPNSDGIVFIYFVPTTFVALCYGNTAAMVATIMSCMFGAYFIQQPTFTFALTNSIDIWDLVFFGLLAMLASRVVAGFANDQSVARRRNPVRPRNAL